MAEDTTLPDAQEIDIEDVSLIDTPDDVATESAESGTTAEDAENEGADTQKDANTDSKSPDAEATEADSEQSEQSEEEQKSEQPDDKATRDQAAARAWQERQRNRQQFEKRLDETYGPKSPEDLQQEGLTPEQAQIEALRQEMAYKEQRTHIAELNAGLISEATEVMSDMPIFREGSPDYDPEFTQMVEQQYKLASRLETDDNGTILHAEVPLYDFYKSMYDMRQNAIARGEQMGQQSAQQMLSRTENPGGSSSTNSTQGDDLDALEERLANVRIA